MKKEEGVTYLMGINPIVEILNQNPKRILRIYTSLGSGISPRKKKVLESLQKARIPIEKKSSDFLERKVGSSSHQGLVAEVVARKPLHLQDFLSRVKSKKKLSVVILDSIYDPQNFGAILRSCECFGIDAALFSVNKGSPMSATVSKASSGASEILPLIQVGNLAEAVRILKKEGFTIAALQAKDGARPLNKHQFSEKTALILGSEGKGIQPLLQKLSDISVYIPMKGKISSLNVAQATSVALFSLSTQA